MLTMRPRIGRLCNQRPIALLSSPLLHLGHNLVARLLLDGSAKRKQQELEQGENEASRNPLSVETTFKLNISCLLRTRMFLEVANSIAI